MCTFAKMHSLADFLNMCVYLCVCVFVCVCVCVCVCVVCALGSCMYVLHCATL